ncbi:hypothetical protein CQ010_17375 [Arthrobacter sp. MYb211]|uniref:hypothetical protein n=1 Tax=Micrococcaceae TaxID=1268 RepID=UPI000CFDA39C|nr:MULTISPECIES: hypothetical protein [unclassified Arthrobacter]PQZ97120.1 hypothetical protein CQ017_14460 [Arthrobacter sp. MYb224]PRA00018.1 hypothetical protein CQ019_16065 [Arthrobacter sp. MYb229]PRA08401.1 hypothetical protein CQ015_17360 [Arthrobacter sp. MYb221]PRB48308.1 hypothetical protein CQ013_15200 [Arthrobacter sp. MYb216]PRC03884.1 hypothetical protein CQ010_17375 [Arthrobacter sp. MYb211]
MNSRSDRITASAAPKSIWLPILGISVLYSLIATAAFFLISWLLADLRYALSGAFAAGLVIGFFAVSILIAEAAGRIRSTWAMPAFLGTFVIKVFGIAFVLLNLGLPEWVNRQGFVLAAAVSLVAWQVGEVRAFMKTRLAIYNES